MEPKSALHFGQVADYNNRNELVDRFKQMIASGMESVPPPGNMMAGRFGNPALPKERIEADRATFDGMDALMPMGMTYEGAKRAVDKILFRLSSGPNKRLEQAIIESNIPLSIHPDALSRLKGIRLVDNPRAIASVRHTELPLDKVASWIDKYSGNVEHPQLAPRGELFGGKADLELNPKNFSKYSDKNMKKVIQHEAGHLNHLYGKEVPLPAYDAVFSNQDLAENILRRTDPGDGFNGAYMLDYYTRNPQELIAELGARSKMYPDRVNMAVEDLLDLNRMRRSAASNDVNRSFNPELDIDLLRQLTKPVLHQPNLDPMVNYTPKMPEARRIIEEVTSKFRTKPSWAETRMSQYPPGTTHVDHTGIVKEMWKTPEIANIPYPGAFSESDLARKLYPYTPRETHHGFYTPKGNAVELGGGHTHREGMDELLGYRSPEAVISNNDIRLGMILKQPPRASKYVNDMYYENPINKLHTYDLPEMLSDTGLSRVWRGAPRLDQRSYIDIPPNITEEQIQLISNRFGKPRNSTLSLTPPDEIMYKLRDVDPAMYQRYMIDDLAGTVQPIDKLVQQLVGNYAEDLAKHLK